MPVMEVQVEVAGLQRRLTGRVYSAFPECGPAMPICGLLRSAFSGKTTAGDLNRQITYASTSGQESTVGNEEYSSSQ